MRDLPIVSTRNKRSSCERARGLGPSVGVALSLELETVRKHETVPGNSLQLKRSEYNIKQLQ